MSNETRFLDIIIFGATGFTGKPTIPQLTKLIKAENLSLTWGVAGRSENKLKKALLEMQQKTGEDYSKNPVIVADIQDADSIEKMTASARIIINAVGPYRLYGEQVVGACVKTGTHYVDVSGEPQFMDLMQLKYHEAAQAKGIYLISACGFDSIPADLGVLFLQKNFGGTLNSVDTYLYISEEGGPYPGAVVHYTTYESAIHGIANWSELKDLRAKLYPNRLPTFKPKVPAKQFVFKNKYINRWCTLFPSSDRSVCYKTQRYMYETYRKRPAQVNCYIAYDGILQLMAILVWGFLILMFSKFSFTKNLLLKYPTLFSCGLISHEGPSEQKQESTIFNFLLVGKGWSETQLEPTDEFSTPPEKEILATITGRNPGYGATCIMLATSAVMILTESDKMPPGGGYYSPGAAFGNTSMIEKLNRYGMKFEMNPKLET